MEYLVGVILALGLAGSAALIGLDCGRAFYPTVLIVIASYYGRKFSDQERTTPGCGHVQCFSVNHSH